MAAVGGKGSGMKMTINKMTTEKTRVVKCSICFRILELVRGEKVEARQSSCFALHVGILSATCGESTARKENCLVA